MKILDRSKSHKGNATNLDLDWETCSWTKVPSDNNTLSIMQGAWMTAVHKPFITLTLTHLEAYMLHQAISAFLKEHPYAS